MIAYRLHFDEATIEAIETVRSGTIGDPRFFSSIFAQQLSEENSRSKARSRRQSRPSHEQIIRLPPVKSQELIGAAAPGGS
jgi:predicted dehydrogenase